MWHTTLDKSQLLSRQADINSVGGSASASTVISTNINTLYQVEAIEVKRMLLIDI